MSPRSSSWPARIQEAPQAWTLTLREAIANAKLLSEDPASRIMRFRLDIEAGIVEHGPMRAANGGTLHPGQEPECWEPVMEWTGALPKLVDMKSLDDTREKLEEQTKEQLSLYSPALDIDLSGYAEQIDSIRERCDSPTVRFALGRPFGFEDALRRVIEAGLQQVESELGRTS